MREERTDVCTVVKIGKNAYNKRSMTLFGEILNSLSAEAGASIQYTVIDGQGGYFQNVRRISEFSDTKIVLRGKKRGVSIEGAELTLGKYGGGDALVGGKIRKIEQID